MCSIFLVGFMGCGKTTVGRVLADRLGWRFIDIDQTIVEAEGVPIPDIFAAGGEKAFRVAERRALESLSIDTEYVVSTGGGLFTYSENRQWIAETGGWSVFLDVPWSILARRLGSIEVNRPMWDNPESARALFDGRQEAYHLADAAVAVGHDDNENDVAEAILRLRPELVCAI